MSSNATPAADAPALQTQVAALSKKVNKYRLELQVKQLELSQAQTQIKKLNITVDKLRQQIEIQRQKSWTSLTHSNDPSDCKNQNDHHDTANDEDNQIIYTDTTDLLSCNGLTSEHAVDHLTNIVQANQIQRSERLDVVTHFNNNETAYNVWTQSCEDEVVTLDSTVNYKRLYTHLCRQFIETTGCSRVPKKQDLLAFVMKYVDDKASFDGQLTYGEFVKFWRWFSQCMDIIDEIAYLWDFNDGQISFLCNVFMGRREVEKLLREHKQGTFILRLASVGGIALSYFEMGTLKHSSLTRKGRNKYEVKRREKGSKREIDSISNIILSYDKITTLYTPHRLYPKNNVFFWV